MATANASESQWEEHSHEAIVHSHSHYHVTHNFRDMTGGFEHLSSEHEHEHDHAEINHRHFPHQDFEQEHGGEAHVHDHVQPARNLEDGNGKKPAAKRAATDAGDGDGDGKKAPAKRTKAAASAK